MKVLVTRTDRLGDLVLSLPVFAALKNACPDWEIHAMVAPGAVPLVENDPHLSRVWTWREDLSTAAEQELGDALRTVGFDAAVMLQYRRQLAKRSSCPNCRCVFSSRGLHQLRCQNRRKCHIF